MFKRCIVSFFLMVLIISLNAIWKYEQEADSNGVDVKYGVLADDWICTETGPITEICFAFSWKNDVVGTISGVTVNIYNDNAGVPGTIIFSQLVTNGANAQYHGVEAWYDPYTNTYIADNHDYYYKRKLVLNPPFIQTAGTHYWLSLIPIVIGTEEIGWKTSLIDPYVTAKYFDLGWEDLLYSGLAFKLSSSDETCPVELSSFTAVTSSSDEVVLTWVTQSETNLSGYNIMRSNTENVADALCCNATVIPSCNSSTEQVYTYRDADIQSQATYWYWLESVEMNGYTQYHGPVYVVTDNPGNPDIPPIDISATRLNSAFPNPFWNNTKISYDLAAPGKVSLEVYNLKGQKIKTLQSIEQKSGGRYTCTWNGQDEKGHYLPSGIYLYKLQTVNHIETKKVILVK